MGQGFLGVMNTAIKGYPMQYLQNVPKPVEMRDSFSKLVEQLNGDKSNYKVSSISYQDIPCALQKVFEDEW